MLALSLGLIFQKLGGGQRDADMRRVAAGLAKDRLETLRLEPFGYLSTTSGGDAPGEGCLASPSAYDRNSDQFPPEKIPWGSLAFRRAICIEAVIPKDGELKRSDGGESTGLKRIVVRVAWPADQPRQEYELESLIQSPDGPISSYATTSQIQSYVQCKKGDRNPEPCPGVRFTVRDITGAVVGTDISDSNGKLHFNHLPLGLNRIKPTLRQDETAEPPEAENSVPTADAVINASSFTITRSWATIHVKTNRPGTLLTVTEGMPSEAPPPVTFEHETATPMFASLIDTEGSLQVTPGSYSVACWWESPVLGRLTMTPPGGTNRLIESGSELDFACDFKN